MMKTFPDFPESPDKNEKLSVYKGEKKIPVKISVLENLLSEIEREQNTEFLAVELVYVDEEEIVEVNKEHLGRDYITDIISFRYDENEHVQAIEGTLYCCAPRITEQSREFGATESQEFYRIFIHGLLHLAGYNDQTDEEKVTMTRLENHYLELFKL